MNENLAIECTSIKKKYKLGAIGGRTLQAELQSWWAKKRGKEDPNMRIGTNTRLIGQEFWALNGIDLQVKKGERLGIIGANGAGKSTLLKLFARVTAPTQGDIYIRGRISSMLEVGTGFHGEMTGRENIYMNGAILGMSKQEIDDRMEEIIDFSEVREFIDTPVKRYSSGMFVKLAFSVMAHLNSEILIMDEVLAVGDMAFQNKCLNKMKEVADKEGKTILYVSHNMQTIRNLCERCIVMDQGQIIFNGDVEEAISKYMDMGLGTDQLDIELKYHSYGNRDLGSGIYMEHLRLLNKMNNIYTSGEDLHFSIKTKISKPLENVVFRMTLRTDADVAIGTAWTKVMSLQSNTNPQHLEFHFPLENIEKGIFYGTIGFYRVDEIGRNFILDVVERAFKIEVQGKPIWNTNVRGYLNWNESIEME